MQPVAAPVSMTGWWVSTRRQAGDVVLEAECTSSKRNPPVCRVISTGGPPIGAQRVRVMPNGLAAGRHPQDLALRCKRLSRNCLCRFKEITPINRWINETLRNDQDTARRSKRPPHRAALSAALVHALVRRRHGGSALRQPNHPTTGRGLTTAQLSTYAVDIVVALCGQSVTYFSNLFSDWVMNHLLSPSVRPACR